MEISDSRKRLSDWIIAQLIGRPSPYTYSEAEDEGRFLKGINPIERFPCGAIYPVFEGEGEDPADMENTTVEELDDGKTTDDGKEAEPVRRYIPPSSIGLSFYLTGSGASIEVSCFASSYENVEDYWIRSEKDDYHVKYYVPDDNNYRERKKVWDGSALTDVLWRKHDEGWIVTISLCNNQKMADKFDGATEFAKERAEKTLFETRFELRVVEGEIGDYPSVNRSLLDDEEQEIDLQYRNRQIYAIGHGTGVDWEADNDGVVRYIWTESIPTAEVPQITANIGFSQVLNLNYLTNAFDDKDEVIGKLSEFVQGYKVWIEDQEREVSKLHDEDKPTGIRIVDRMNKAEERMSDGIRLLDSDTDALRAFSLANQGILNQMVQARGEAPEWEPYSWRPFQLAFLLAVLESATNNESEYRDIVDLIWFPTGGGKTEAYFGLISYMVLYRRLKYPATSEGTTALMRYTLRLLSKDQYLRAARLICALELIRRSRDDLGDTPISIGMWVGGDASPNSFHDAYEQVRKAQETNREPSLVIDKCPWCGSPFSIKSGNYHSGEDHFYFECVNEACEFGSSKEPLPCNVVDDQLYENPPTLIISTVDKFARMAWEERVGNFFGRQGNRPPELIIQDELHLISGALGSINGLYEAAIDSTIKLRGVYPKYIASTATIRTADIQIRRLYGRDAAVFPPPGIDCDDSYFAKTVPLTEKPGRLYLGYYAPMLTRQKCLAPLAAALLAAPISLFVGDEYEDRLLDAWWTNIVYHGSLKGLANSHMAYDSDIRDRLRIIIDEIIAHENGEEKKNRVVKLLESRVPPSVEELTSHKTAAENAETFSRLAIMYPENGYLDVALATNMVSVGLDVSRLALMVINGQPLTTAEYIQASSRVGRSDVPGIVFVNYYRDQTRSLSHYEQFKAYHGAFYRYVEPTSVTPFTWQARNKALHAAIVIVIRHGIDGISEPSSYSEQNEYIIHALEVLKRRCSEADEVLAEEVCKHIDLLSEKWELEKIQFAEEKRGFKYYSKGDRATESLLCNSDDRIQGIWQTLQSMRNVENTALIKEILPRTE